jgi:pimeloyl-ACP methyl ester carboxylesterase
MSLSTAARPTVVLVHGAFAESASWNGVIARLEDDGCSVVAAANSFSLAEGESTGELAGKFPGNELGSALRPVPVRGPDGGTVDDLYIRQDRFREVFAADVPEETAALMAVTQRPIVADALADQATRAAWRTIPSWTLVTVRDLAVPAESQRFMAERAGSHTVEVDASHAVTVSQPLAVARLIDEAARATVG